jgi:hypothetical protein
MAGLQVEFVGLLVGVSRFEATLDAIDLMAKPKHFAQLRPCRSHFDSKQFLGQREFVHNSGVHVPLPFL